MEVKKQKRVVLNKKELESDILDRGLTRKEIAEKYELSMSQMTKAIKQAGLSNLKRKKVDFIFDDELQEQAENNNQKDTKEHDEVKKDVEDVKEELTENNNTTEIITG